MTVQKHVCSSFESLRATHSRRPQRRSLSSYVCLRGPPSFLPSFLRSIMGISFTATFGCSIQSIIEETLSLSTSVHLYTFSFFLQYLLLARRFSASSMVYVRSLHLSGHSPRPDRRPALDRPLLLNIHPKAPGQQRAGHGERAMLCSVPFFSSPYYDDSKSSSDRSLLLYRHFQPQNAHKG